MIERFLAPSIRRVEYPWGGLLAQAAEAKGARINATLGVFLDDELRIGIVPAVSSRVSLERSQITEYAPSHGVLALRQLWRQRLVDLGHIDERCAHQMSQPIVSAGLTAGLSLAGQMFLEPRASELVLSDPCWPNYELMFRDIQHTALQPFPMFTEGNAGPRKSDTAAMVQALDRSARSVAQDLPLVVLLNTPHNPTGYSYTNEEATSVVKALQDFLQRHPQRRLVVIIDDAYSGFVFEDSVRTRSLLRDLADLDERLLAVHISGATKEIYAWGLRVGFVTFAGKSRTQEDLRFLEDKAAAFVRGTLSNVSMLSQHLAIETLRDPSTAATHRDYESLMKARYLRCRKELERPDVSAHFEALPFNSGYFFALKLRDDKIDAEVLRKALLEKHSAGVITIGKNLVRIAFSAITVHQVSTLFDALVSTVQELVTSAP